jgi:hypothetical protein
VHVPVSGTLTRRKHDGATLETTQARASPARTHAARMTRTHVHRRDVSISHKFRARPHREIRRGTRRGKDSERRRDENREIERERRRRKRKLDEISSVVVVGTLYFPCLESNFIIFISLSHFTAFLRRLFLDDSASVSTRPFSPFSRSKNGSMCTLHRQSPLERKRERRSDLHQYDDIGEHSRFGKNSPLKAGHACREKYRGTRCVHVSCRDILEIEAKRGVKIRNGHTLLSGCSREASYDACTHVDAMDGNSI